MILVSRVVLYVIIFILKIKCNYTGAAGAGLEVERRAKNGHFEGVEFCLARPLLDTSQRNSHNYYIYFSSTITHYYKGMEMV